MKVKAMKTFACGRYYVTEGETVDIPADNARTVLRMGLAEIAEETEKEPEKEPVAAPAKKLTKARK